MAISHSPRRRAGSRNGHAAPTRRDVMAVAVVRVRFLNFAFAFLLMPFTPFHMGPAASLKLIGGSWFSFAIFGYAQILMDLEPLLALIDTGTIVHGRSHTLGGALAITGFVIVTGRVVYRLGAGLWNRRLPLRELEIPDTVPFTAVVVGALLGTLSHLLLDAMMNADVAPFAPVSSANPLLAVLSPGAIHLVCIGTGIVGVFGLLALRIWHDVEELADD